MLTERNQNHVVEMLGSERSLVLGLEASQCGGLEDTNKMATDERWLPVATTTNLCYDLS